MPIRATLNTVWYYLTKDADRKGIETLRANLLRPLPGLYDEVSEEAISYEKEMFQKAFGRQGLKGA
jgi:hypothetical protein